MSDRQCFLYTKRSVQALARQLAASTSRPMTAMLADLLSKYAEIVLQAKPNDTRLQPLYDDVQGHLKAGDYLRKYDKRTGKVYTVKDGYKPEPVSQPAPLKPWDGEGPDPNWRPPTPQEMEEAIAKQQVEMAAWQEKTKGMPTYAEWAAKHKADLDAEEQRLLTEPVETS